MVFDVSVALSWILYLALFPIAFVWLRRAWRIGVRRDFSEVALRRGESPPNAEKYAPYDLALHLIAGGIVAFVIVSVALGELEYQTWTAIAGSTIWCKVFLSYALARQAHNAAGKAKT
jgi:putative exporter of polyketide antibiotics